MAGLEGHRGSVDGTGGAAQFSYPNGLAVDGAGNVYVADSRNNTIRKITPAGVVNTLAGFAGSAGSADGTGSGARFYNPTDVAADNAGNVYVADTNNHTIRKITPAGEVNTLAGLAGSSGSADGTGSAARFYYPTGVEADSAGNVYVADNNNGTIRKVTATGTVSTLADGAGSVARFSYPAGVAVDDVGNVYVTVSYSDYVKNTNIVCKITPAGVVSNLAGLPGGGGSADGAGGAARFAGPSGVAVDSAGNVYVADTGNDTIRKITPDGVVTTLAGLAGTPGELDGPESLARFSAPGAVAVDGAGYVYVADELGETIRKVDPFGGVSTLAGLAYNSGVSDGIGSAARFNSPGGIGVDDADNIYVADTNNSTIRKITPAGVVSTLAGRAGINGFTGG